MPNTSSNPPPPPLTSQERSRLRAAAHALNPVVLIGERGLSDAVLKEIDRALAAHQLIKVRAASQERDARDAILTDICAALGCQPVHHLGKMLILYRPAPVAETSPEARTRKASAPYVPKKQAAIGKPTGKPAKKPSPRRPQANSELAMKKPRVAASKQPANKPAARKTTAARAGSALSLRAGARSLSRTIGTRNTPSRTKPRSR